MSAVMKDKPLDMGKMLFESIAETNAVMMRGVEAGAEGVWIKVGPSILALEKHYRAAQANPEAKLPTALSLAIEGLLKLATTEGASPYTDRRAQRRVGNGDMSPRGGELEPGT